MMLQCHKHKFKHISQFAKKKKSFKTNGFQSGVWGPLGVLKGKLVGTL